MSHNGSYFNAQRMISQYIRNVYEPGSAPAEEAVHQQRHKKKKMRCGVHTSASVGWRSGMTTRIETPANWRG